MTNILTSELAGLATALLWAFTAICWGILGRRIHPTAVAALRLVLAAAVMTVVHFVIYGSFWPTQLPGRALGVIALSGLAGAGIGDIFYFHGIQKIGPRLSLTIAALTPVVATLLATLPPMHEHLSLQIIAGMVLAIGGVAWVVLEKDGRTAWPTTPAGFRQGVILAVLSVFFQALGYVCSRAGMNAFTTTPVPSISATLIRLCAGGIWCCALLLLNREARATISAVRERRTLTWLLSGVTTGPVLGIWLSMVALQGAPTGVATTLISLSPLFLIPMAWIAYGERPTLGRVLATLVALSGIACMMCGG